MSGVYRSSSDPYLWFIYGTASINFPWNEFFSGDGFATSQWLTIRHTHNVKPGYLPLINLSSQISDPNGDHRNEDRVTFDISGTYQIILKDVEYVDSTLNTNTHLRHYGHFGFSTDGSLNSITADVGNHYMDFTTAIKDNSLNLGNGWDIVTLGDHLDIPGRQYWSIIRRENNELDAYSLLTGSRIRMEGGAESLNGRNGNRNFGEVEELLAFDAKALKQNPNAGPVVFIPGGDDGPTKTSGLNAQKMGLQSNIDLRSDGETFSDSFNLAYFNFIRYTSDNVWAGEATIHDGTNFSAPSDRTVTATKYGFDAPILEGQLSVIGQSRNGTHDLIVGQQTNAIDGNLRLYTGSVSSGLYNEFNNVFLGSAGADAISFASRSSNAAADRVALYGFGGNDTLIGGAGKDYLFGGQSVYNQLLGSAGAGNQVTGGRGADFFGVGNTDSAGAVEGANRIVVAVASGVAWQYSVDGGVNWTNGVAADWANGLDASFERPAGNFIVREGNGGATGKALSWFHQGHATDVIMDWDISAGEKDTLVVLSNGVAVINGLRNGAATEDLSGANTIDLRATAAVATSDQNGTGARGGDGWDADPTLAVNPGKTLQYIFDNQAARDAKSITNENDVTVVNDGLIVIRGLDGSDTIYGSAGNDYIYGNSKSNVIDISSGGNDRVFYDTFDGSAAKHFVTGFTVANGGANAAQADMFFVNKRVIDAFSGSDSTRDLVSSNSTGTYTGAVAYSAGLNFLHSNFYNPGIAVDNETHKLADGRGLYDFNTFQLAQDNLGGGGQIFLPPGPSGADGTTSIIGAVMGSVGKAMFSIPIVGKIIGSALIASGKLLGGVGGLVVTSPHQNATYDSNVGNYLNVLTGSGLTKPNTSGNSTLNTNIKFLDFFPSVNANDGFLPVVEFTAHRGQGIYGYFAMHSSDHTFVYLVASRDNLVENSEAILVAQLNGHLKAEDFGVYDGNYDIYNFKADGEPAVVLLDPIVNIVSDSNTTPDIGFDRSLLASSDTNDYLIIAPADATLSKVRVTGIIEGTPSAGSQYIVYDGSTIVFDSTRAGDFSGASFSTATSGTNTTFTFVDGRALGTIAIVDRPEGVAGDGNWTLTDSRVTYTVELRDGTTGIATRGSVSTVTVEGGLTTIDGGTGNDTLTITKTSGFLNAATDAQIQNFQSIIIASSGSDGVVLDLHRQHEGFTITGTSNGDTITGGQGANNFIGGAGNDLITGGAGNDTFNGFSGQDTLIGGSGTDTLLVFGTSTDLNGATNNQLQGINIVKLEIVERLPEFSVLVGANGVVTGVFVEDPGNGLADGGPYTVVLTGSPGSGASVTVNVSDGSIVEPAITQSGAPGSLPIVSAGTDYSDSSTYTLSAGAIPYAQLGGEVVLSNQNDGFTILGSQYDDTLIGSSGNDSIVGGSGNDSLFGGAGNDTISGGGGADVINAGSGANVITDAGLGADVITHNSASSTVMIAVTGTDTVTLTATQVGATANSAAVNTTVNASSSTAAVKLNGNSGADRLTGGSGNDTIIGGAGNDTLVGGGGQDVLWGGQGLDHVTATAGDKVIVVGNLSAYNATNDPKIALINSTLQTLTGSSVAVDASYTTDVEAGETITFNIANSGDRFALHLFGDVDLTGVIFRDENGNALPASSYDIYTYSSLKLTTNQLLGANSITLVDNASGTSSHSLVITDGSGVALSNSNQLTELSDWLERPGQQLVFGAGTNPAGLSVGGTTKTFTANPSTPAFTGEKIQGVAVGSMPPGNPIGANPNKDTLLYDARNDSNTANGKVGNGDFENPTTVSGRHFRIDAGDRFKGALFVSNFEPGITAVPVPQTFLGYGDDIVHNSQFEVYYGDYDHQTDTFTVTSTPTSGRLPENQGPNPPPYTLILYDNDTSSRVQYIDGLVFANFMVEKPHSGLTGSWTISQGGSANATLFYGGGSTPLKPSFVLGTNNSETLFATATNPYVYALGGNDSIIGTTGNDFIFAGTGADTVMAGRGADVIDLGNTAFDGINGDGSADLVIVNSSLNEISDSRVIAGLPALGTRDADFFEVREIRDVGGISTLQSPGKNETGEDYVYNFERGLDSLRVVATDVSSYDHTVNSFEYQQKVNAGTVAEVDQVTLVLNLYGSDIRDDNIGITFRDFGDHGGIPRFFRDSVQYYLTGTSGNDRIVGGALADSLVGGAGNDTLIGGAGDDTLVGGAGANVLTGGSGNDTFITLAGANDTITDLSTGDAFTVAATGSVTATNVSAFVATSATMNAGTVSILASDSGSVLNLANAGGSAGYTIQGGNGADLIIGSAFADSIVAGDGNDTLIGGAGADTLIGGAGNDTFRYVTTADTATTNDINQMDWLLDFDIADDVLDLTALGAVTNVIATVDTNDPDSYVVQWTSGSGVDAVTNYVYLKDTGIIGGLTLTDTSGIVTVGATTTQTLAFTTFTVSSTGVVVGNNSGAPYRAYLHDPATTPVKGSRDSDTGIYTVSNNLGASSVYTFDTTVVPAGTSGVVEANMSLINTNTGLTNTHPKTLSIGTSGNDVITINNTNGGIAYGNDGDDLITGGSGDDFIFGGDGNDTIIGGAGNDTIIGGAGQDTLTGGAGQDTFVWGNVAHSTSAAPDTVTDFAFNGASGDVLDITGLTGENDIAYANHVFATLGDLINFATSDLTTQTANNDIELFVGLVNGVGAYVLANETTDLRDGVEGMMLLSGVGSLADLTADSFLGERNLYSVSVDSAPPVFNNTPRVAFTTPVDGVYINFNSFNNYARISVKDPDPASLPMQISNVFVEIEKINGVIERVNNIEMYDSRLYNSRSEIESQYLINFSENSFGTWAISTSLAQHLEGATPVIVVDLLLVNHHNGAMESGNGDAKDMDVTFGFTASDAVGNSDILSFTFAIDGSG